MQAMHAYGKGAEVAEAVFGTAVFSFVIDNYCLIMV